MTSAVQRGAFDPTHRVVLVGSKPGERREVEVSLGADGNALTREQWERGRGPADPTWMFLDGEWYYGDFQTKIPPGYRVAKVHKLGLGPTARGGSSGVNIVFRATPAERDAIDADALARGEDRSTWIRRAIAARFASSSGRARSARNGKK